MGSHPAQRSSFALLICTVALAGAPQALQQLTPGGGPTPGRARPRPAPEELTLEATLAPGTSVLVGELITFDVVVRGVPGTKVRARMLAPPAGLVFEPVVDGAPTTRRQVRWHVARDFLGPRSLVFEARDDAATPRTARLELPVHVSGPSGMATRTEHGDVTGDGIPDLIAAAFGADVGGKTDVGAVYLWIGGGPPSIAPDVVLRVPGAGSGDQLGKSILRLAELTGDGVLDIVACSPSATIGGVLGAGAVYVWKGGAHLGTPLAEPVGPTAILAETTVGSNVGFGTGPSQSVYLRDVDGDAQADVMVVAPLADRTGAKDSGVVCIWSGGPGLVGQPGPTASFRVLTSVTDDQLGLGHEISSTSGKGFHVNPGFAGSDGVLFGDVTGDGRLDVVINASEADGAEADVGMLYVFRAGVPLSGQQAPYATLFVEGAAAGDRLGVGYLTYLGQGFRLADVTGDGVDDVIAVARLADVEGQVDAGAAYVWAGGASLVGNVDATARLRPGTPEAGANFGRTAAGRFADVTGDGFPDLVLGTQVVPRGGNINVGEAYVFAGGPGLSGDVTPRATLVSPSTRLNTFFSMGGSPSGYGPFFGMLLEDVTGDGVADVLGLARGAEVDGVAAAGAVYLWHGGDSLSGSLAPQASLRRAAPRSGDQVGQYGLRVVDVTGDRVPEILAISGGVSFGSQISAGAILLWSAGTPLTGDVSHTALLRTTQTEDFQNLGIGHLSEGPTMRFADVTGDGVLDVVASSSRADIAGPETGGVFVWAGAASLTGRIYPTAELLPNTVSSQLTYAEWGHPFRLADVTGDGILDVLVQDIERKIASQPFAGSLDVWAGGPTLTGQPPALAVLAATNPTNNHRVGQAAGNAVKLFDLNGDGLLDVLIGAEEADVPGAPDGGSILFFPGPITPASTDTELYVVGGKADDGLGD